MFVPKSALAIVSHCDAESSRYALGAVQFERDENGKALAVATDGRRLAVLSWDDADILPVEGNSRRDAMLATGLAVEPVSNFKILINMADLKRAGKLLTAKPSIQTAWPVLGSILIDEVSANGKVSMGATDGANPSTMTVASTDGRFPKWRDVMPSSAETVSIKLDARYLAEACKLLGDFAGDDESRAVTITLHKDESIGGTGDYSVRPAVITATGPNGRTGKVIIMPLPRD